MFLASGNLQLPEARFSVDSTTSTARSSASVTTPEALRDNLLAGRAPTPEEIDAFIVDHADEGPTHDFKDGALLDDKKKRNLELRRHITGFANGDGGVLIVGVNERERGSDERRRFTGTPQNIGKAPIADWVADALADLAGYFSPQPRAEVVPHPAGDVLLVATGRAPRLVPLAEERQRLKFWMRIGHCTVEVPDYLLSDLVLGRRAGPDLHLELVSFKTSATFDDGRRRWLGRIDLEVRIDNRSFTHASRVETGCLFLGGKQLNTAPTFLQGHVEIADPDPDLQLELVHWHGPVPERRASFRPPAHAGEIAPFASRQLPMSAGVNIPLDDGHVQAAFYVIADGAPPVWFQFDADIVATSTRDRRRLEQAQLQRTLRPRVSLVAKLPE